MGISNEEIVKLVQEKIAEKNEVIREQQLQQSTSGAAGAPDSYPLLPEWEDALRRLQDSGSPAAAGGE